MIVINRQEEVVHTEIEAIAIKLRERLSQIAQDVQSTQSLWEDNDNPKIKSSITSQLG